MDDAIRAEYQQRLDSGDKEGALSYLRMLRTQTDDPNARSAYQQAIDGIEGGGSAASSYQGAVGPFGDNPQNWEASRHAGGRAAAAQANDLPAPGLPTPQPDVRPGAGDFGAAQSGAVGAESGSGMSGVDTPYTPPAATSVPSGAFNAGAPAAAAPGAHPHQPNLGAEIGNFIGGRLQEGLHNMPGFGGQAHPQHPAAPAPPPHPAPPAAPSHQHSIFGHKFDAETSGGNSGAVADEGATTPPQSGRGFVPDEGNSGSGGSSV